MASASASVPALLGLLFIAGLGIPIPQDPLMVTVGVVAHMGGTPVWLAVVSCAGALSIGDAVVFTLGRRLGDAALDHRWLRWLLPPSRRSALERMVERRGDAVVFFARHLPGLRAPIFLFVGMKRMRPTRFLLWNTLGLLFSATVAVLLGWLGSEHVERVRQELARAEHWVLAIFGAAAAVSWFVLAHRNARRVERRPQVEAKSDADEDS